MANHLVAVSHCNPFNKPQHKNLNKSSLLPHTCEFNDHDWHAKGFICQCSYKKTILNSWSMYTHTRKFKDNDGQGTTGMEEKKNDFARSHINYNDEQFC